MRYVNDVFCVSSMILSASGAELVGPGFSIVARAIIEDAYLIFRALCFIVCNGFMVVSAGFIIIR